MFLLVTVASHLVAVAALTTAASDVPSFACFPLSDAPASAVDADDGHTYILLQEEHRLRGTGMASSSTAFPACTIHSIAAGYSGLRLPLSRDALVSESEILVVPNCTNLTYVGVGPVGPGGALALYASGGSPHGGLYVAAGAGSSDARHRRASAEAQVCKAKQYGKILLVCRVILGSWKRVTQAGTEKNRAELNPTTSRLYDSHIALSGLHTDGRKQHHEEFILFEKDHYLPQFMIRLQ
eukprot:TRINITY_DN621_c0_g2_i1.p1 TRINITY_DN621_c0_g2~~TRINITY_DN621_c0_g2_i1.p1  ORF type:complete len:239 (-),score=57.33 TRINITY_DN621_c0_g2_i1:111-827(-)